jgi:alpha-L-fucosidase
MLLPLAGKFQGKERLKYKMLIYYITAYMIKGKKNIVLLGLGAIFIFSSGAARAQAVQSANKPARVSWFENLGFGLFIHWGVDVSLGAVISHSLAGASDEYVNKYMSELPGMFDPERFDPDQWAKLAKLAGMKYMVFTAKHHSGFCMFDTKTTSFNVMNTPFKRDIVKEVIEAFRKQGIAIGIYFSPEDFNYFWHHHIPIGRLQFPQQYPVNNPDLMAYDKQQLKELLTNYGKIDILFIDGPPEGLREYAWKLNPDLVITRGAMETPEQNTPNEPLPRPWEACYTMGTDWQYKATNDPQKSGTTIINKLIEIRAKGGNFLLNVGPRPNGELQVKQEDLLREIATWNFVNGEAIYDVKPLPVVHEGNIWYTQSNDGKDIYAFIVRSSPNDWRYGTRKAFTFSRLRGTANTKVSVLGYKSELVEYKPGFDAKVYTSSTPAGLIVSAVNGQRLYTNNQWPNAVVLKIENAEFVKESQVDNRSKIDGAK